MSDFCYVNDPARNILSKTFHGKTTRFPYDAANQIMRKEAIISVKGHRRGEEICNRG